MDDLAALLANIEREHAARAEQEAARATTARQIARLNARTPKRGGADLAAGEKDDQDQDECSRTQFAGGSDHGHDNDKPRDAAFGARPTIAINRTEPAARDADGALFDPGRCVGASVDVQVAGMAAAAAKEAGPEVDPYSPDPYSPDPRLYPPEWLAEFDRRCDEAVAQMQAAIGAGERP